MAQGRLAAALRFPPNRPAMRAFFLVGPLAVLALVAVCDRSSSGSVTPSGSASAPPPPLSGAAPDAAPTYGLGNPPQLPDADLDTLMNGLKCTPTAAQKPGPCNVVAAMQKCREWGAVPPSGERRFIGHGWQVTGQKTSDVVTLLRTRKVAAALVARWQLPIKIGVGSIGKDTGPPFAQADLAISAYCRHTVPPIRNAAIDYVKQKADWADEAPAARTTGSMVETFSDYPTYVCQGEGGQVELVRQASADIGLRSDGLYAELWATDR
jgi:hypothetical protein